MAAGALDSMLLVPYIVPGVVMGLAFVVTFNVPPLQITGTVSALSTILLAATGLAVFIVFRISGRKESAFV